MIMREMNLKILVAIAMGIVAVCGSSRAECRNEAYMIAKDTVDIATFGRTNNNQIIIEKDIDLGRAVCKVPRGKVLVIKKGTIRNGTLIGNNTQLNCKQNAFDKATIQETWIVPEISTIFFVDLKRVNSLKSPRICLHERLPLVS